MQISLEFFPPKTESAQASLADTARTLARLHPQYVSVTYGAGGSTREGTLSTVTQMQGIFQKVAPHVSCIGASTEEMTSLLTDYQSKGISRLVALRGDLPSGYGQGGAFAHAEDLVCFIRQSFGQAFEIEVAAYPEIHPQAKTAQDDLRHFVNKVKAGANGAITQYFFNSDAYFRFVDEAYQQGIDIPITPGIMPITNYSQLARFSDACGADIPRWIRQRLAGFGDDVASIRAFGQEVITDLVDQLVTAGVPGLHFYTMNRAEPTLAIVDALGLKGQPG
ncbi:methylenetetrahydrofolate reductase [NAD(P)H] [Betaproteobacteria bacterium LSUCC0115]|nr:methylenetetrahydrofolate reductase [NAD(P)H] [Burkholderiales bacterium LSUCC0115]